MSTPSLPLPAARQRLRPLAISFPRPELAVLLVAAGVLYLWALDRNGFANEYYSAAVRSMSTSWHAFLYGSFDTAGVMTVDKPPLALWVQALSVRVFGFNSWSLLVPQALMGVATVALVYDLTRRRFGRVAGFVAGLALVLTPVTVAIARHNNPDALLVLCCTAALWAVVRGLDDGRTRWVVLAGVAVGLGFEAKMGAALLVVPALAVAWLWVAPRGRAAAVRSLAAGGAAMTAVGLAWPVLVWLTPAADRPWISGTSDNSVWSLILGYNGLGRILGQDGGPGGAGGAGGPGGGGPFGGDPGAMRLLNEALGGEAGWLLGAAVAAGIGVIAITRLRRSDPRTGWLLAVGGAGLTTAVAFSQAEGIFHPYYVSQLAPMIAALAGAGVAVILRGGTPARVLGPAFVLAGVATEWIVLRNVSDLTWLPPLLVAAGAGAAVLLAADVMGTRGRAAVVAGAIAALLFAPASWSLQTLGYATSGTFPAGGPAASALAGGPGGGAGRFGGGAAPPALGGIAPPALGGTAPGGGGATPFGGDTSSLSAAVAYAESNGGGTIVVASQSGAAGSLITSGAEVAAIGGFSGRESQVSTAWLADAVESGQIRYVLTSAAGGMGNDDRVGASDVMAAVEAVGTPVSGVDGLYDMQGTADALRAFRR
ncbi:MAG TPA: glycosyltransferase family 39 protein [Solirubrobacteraceae bacterium]|jgi:4-amino-4-deoxy-L-arabinose transferase-like glycosyltransferase|nr:glycosyltransferase family 39 protein [Solirubrobacteraceae bacterium]